MRSAIAPRTASGLRPVVGQLLCISVLATALPGCKTFEDEPGAHLAGWTIVDATQRHPIMVSQQPSTPANAGHVIGSNPAQGTMVATGSTVVLLVGTSTSSTTSAPHTTTTT